MDGIFVIDKPRGMTSHDVVDEVRARLGVRRVGHAGTLDPDATGVLLVGVGRATRFLAYAQGGPKRYLAEATFGVSTTTQDASGEVVASRPAVLGRARVSAALLSFTGDIEQVPPMVSAVKVGGEPLYRKARRGESVERAARRVRVDSIDLVGWSEGDRPVATLDVRCSAGVYIRTLVADLGGSLGCGAHLSALRRTEAGGYDESSLIPLGDVGPDTLRPLVDAVAGLARVEANAEAARRVANGRPLEARPALAEGEAVAIVRDRELLAVYQRRGDALVAERVVGPVA